jgi:hypothetical protein
MTTVDSNWARRSHLVIKPTKAESKVDHWNRSLSGQSCQSRSLRLRLSLYGQSRLRRSLCAEAESMCWGGVYVLRRSLCAEAESMWSKPHEAEFILATQLGKGTPLQRAFVFGALISFFRADLRAPCSRPASWKFVCVCMCMHVYSCVFMLVHVFCDWAWFICMRLALWLSENVHVYMPKYVRVCPSVYLCLCTYICALPAGHTPD